MPTLPLPFSSLLGQRATLTLRRIGPSGAFLSHQDADSEAPTLLLLGPEIPEGAKPGDEISVFVYLDSEGRPLATTTEPKLRLGQVAFLEVSACTDVGAFFDWGLPKELLVPFAEQTRELQVGERHAVGLYVDKRGRLTGTMKVRSLLDQAEHPFRPDQWVEGEAWRKEPELGVFVILERAWVGLLPNQEPHRLERGEACRCRIATVFEDGKLELSLRRHAHEELDADAEKLMTVLGQPKAPRLGDHSPPEQIRSLLGLSKKAFKRAVGRLLRQGRATLDEGGHVVPVAPVESGTQARQRRASPKEEAKPGRRPEGNTKPNTPGKRAAKRTPAKA